MIVMGRKVRMMGRAPGLFIQGWTREPMYTKMIGLSLDRCGVIRASMIEVKC